MPTRPSAVAANQRIERIFFTADVDGLSQLFAIAPDGTGTVTLSPAQENVRAWALAPDGRRIALALDRDTSSDVVIIPVDTHDPPTVIAHDQPAISALAWSPDGTRIAFVATVGDNPSSANEDIFVLHADGSGLTRLTDDPLPDVNPVWSPDGAWIAFERGDDRLASVADQPRVFVMRADGSDQRALTPADLPSHSPHWSSDSTALMLIAGTPPHRYTVYADGSGLSDQGPLPPHSYHVTPSPDGQRIAFVRQQGECQVESCTRHIYLLHPNGDVQQPTHGTTNVRGDSLINDRPAWSPDGARLVFRSNRAGDIALYTMRADGSDQQRLTERAVDLGRFAWVRLPVVPSAAHAPAPTTTQLSRGPSGMLAVANRVVGASSTDIYLVPLEGGAPRQVTHHPANDEAPAWSPDGTQIAFRSDRDGGPALYLTTTEGSRLKRLVSSTFDAPIGGVAWSPDGQTLVYDQHCALKTIAVDGGEPRILLEPPVGRDVCFREPRYTPDGRSVVFAASLDSARSAIFVISVRDGTTTQLTEYVDGPASERAPVFSPDGTQLAFVSEREGRAHIYLVDARGKNLRRLTTYTISETAPTWSPDGRWIACTGTAENGDGIMIFPADTTTTSDDQIFRLPMPPMNDPAFGDYTQPAWKP
jgi:Tol biopolymer transport system component